MDRFTRTFLTTVLICVVIFASLIFFLMKKDRESPVIFVEEKYPYRKFNDAEPEETTVEIPINRYSVITESLKCKDSDNYVTVTTSRGKLRGNRRQELGVEISEFLSVPYAEPPIDNLRFENPKKLIPWDGVRDALKWPQVCSQPNLDQFKHILAKGGNLLTLNSDPKEPSEDCLYLNIWTPNANNKGGALLPVLAVLPGGGFTAFGISFNAGKGTAVAAVANVVVVAIQYRLGILGFLKYDDQHDRVNGNMGLADQIMALQWIRDNIESFGGDPNQVTLSGQSAGGISIGLLMASTGGRQLFKRAILQSGTPGLIIDKVYTTFDKNYEYFVNQTECGNKQKKIQCLKGLSAKSLIKTQSMLIERMPMYVPSIPHHILPQLTRQAFSVDDAEDDIYQTEVLIGINKNEASLFLPIVQPNRFSLDPDIVPYVTVEDIRQFLSETIEKAKIAPEVVDVNRIVDLFSVMIGVEKNSTQDITEILTELITEIFYACPALSMANSLQEWNTTKVYMYYISTPLDHLKWPKWMSVPHIDELQSVFGLPLLYPHIYSGHDLDFSKRIIDIWAHFTKTGLMLPQLGVDWPLYTESSPKHMELNSGYAKIGSKLNTNYCVFIDHFLEMINASNKF